MGSVFKALDKNLDKVVAIKVLSNEFFQSEPKALQRFQKEAQLAGKLNHDNLVTVLDFGVCDEDRFYLVMDFAEGQTLKNIIAKSKTLPISITLEIAIQLADGMRYAHGKGIVHRDLKPANIVVSDYGKDNMAARVIDFGIARSEHDEQSGQKLTNTNAIVGSPLYISPEQIRGEKADARSDIYSLGCMIFECLTGRPPFKGNTALDTMSLHSSQLPETVSTLMNGGCPETLDAMVAKCLEKAPDRRYQTMKELLEDLELIASDLQATEEESKPGISVQKLVQKTPPAVFAAAAALIIGVGITSYLTVNNKLRKDKRTDQSKISTDRTKTMLGIEPVKLKNLREEIARTEPGEFLSLRSKNVNLSMLLEANSSGLTRLDARTAAFEDTRDLCNLTNIKKLKLSDTNVDDVGATALKQCRKLVYLDLSTTNIGPAGIKQLASLPALERLELNGCNLQVSDLEPLSAIPTLAKLEIRGLPFSKEDFQIIAKFKHLKKVYLSDRADVTEEEIKSFEEQSGCQIKVSGDKNPWRRGGNEAIKDFL